jgi:hypothetical protein
VHTSNLVELVIPQNSVSYQLIRAEVGDTAAEAHKVWGWEGVSNINSGFIISWYGRLLGEGIGLYACTVT